MNDPLFWIAVGVVALGFLAMVTLLLINSYRLSMAYLRITDLEEAYIPHKHSAEQRQTELAHVRALRDKVAETALFIQLSQEMGWTYTDEDDDTIAVGEE